MRELGKGLPTCAMGGMGKEPQVDGAQGSHRVLQGSCPSIGPRSPPSGISICF